MSIEYNPVGITCNLGCAYCYQTPMRDAKNLTKKRDIEKVKESLIAEGGQFTIFGGEALLAPIDHLEEMWKWGKENFGYNGVQTNGVLINDDHIKLFKKYGVNPGISVDGPGELNDSRWRGSLKGTREATKKTLDNIDKLIEHGIIPSLIITLYQGNVRNGRIEILKDWIRGLDKKGVRHVRLHTLEVDHKKVAEVMAMEPEENFKALIEMHELESELINMRFDIFDDIKMLLAAEDDRTTCIWNACDPYTTSAVRGVDENGDRHNCGRTNKDGVNWFKADQPSYERQISLYHVPWENGGCKGCRFFAICKGNCPGTGVGMDWRKKSDNCWMWYKLIEYIETDIVDNGGKPVTLHPMLREIEKTMLKEWAEGRRVNIKGAIRILNENFRAGSRRPSRERGSVHTDAHGDGTYSEIKENNHSDNHTDSARNDNVHQDNWT